MRKSTFGSRLGEWLVKFALSLSFFLPPPVQYYISTHFLSLETIKIPGFIYQALDFWEDNVIYKEIQINLLFIQSNTNKMRSSSLNQERWQFKLHSYTSRFEL